MLTRMWTGAGWGQVSKGGGGAPCGRPLAAAEPGRMRST